MESLETKSDDLLIANALMAGFDVAQKANLMASPDLLAIVTRASQSPGPQTIHTCARVLWVHKGLTDQHVLLLLQALHAVDPSHAGTIEELDNGLGTLLDTPHAEQAIEYLATRLAALEEKLSLANFDAFSGKLLKGPQERFGRVVVSWLLSGHRVLCEGLSHLLGREDQKAKPINVALLDFNLSPFQQIFLCRKAVGYFFLQPVVAGSIVVSVLRTCSDEIRSAIQELLFDPLLLNYGGEYRNYLQAIDTTDPAHPAVQSVLKRGNDYWTEIESVGQIKELRPSERERQVERLRMRDQMREVQKGAEKASILMSLVKRSVLLYDDAPLPM
jgi:hypothetical protein